MLRALAFVFLLLTVLGCKEQQDCKAPAEKEPDNASVQLLVKGRVKPMTTSPEIECAGVDVFDHSYLWCQGTSSQSGLAPLDYLRKGDCPPCECQCTCPPATSAPPTYGTGG